MYLVKWSKQAHWLGLGFKEIKIQDYMGNLSVALNYANDEMLETFPMDVNVFEDVSALPVFSFVHWSLRLRGDLSQMIALMKY